jgi:hypothetical protein
MVATPQYKVLQDGFHYRFISTHLFCIFLAVGSADFAPIVGILAADCKTVQTAWMK